MNTKIVIAIVAIALIGLGGFAYMQKKNGTYDAPYTSSTETTSQNGNASTTDAVPTPTQPVKTTFTAADVAGHADATSCYTIVSGSVYDLTQWIARHPGGKSAIMGICGKDGTQAFLDQHGGQGRPESTLTSFKIGTLAQ